MPIIKNRKSFLLVVFILSVTLAIAAAMIYSFYIGRKIAVRYTPLIDAAMEIKLEAAITHLWFEEIISGDRYMDIEVVWQHLEESKWYARAMLEGGENMEGVFVPLENPLLRKEIEKTLEGLQAFQSIAEERWALRTQSGIGSDIDQQFDRTFNEFLLRADNVETTLQNILKIQLVRYEIIQWGLVIVVLIIGCMVGFMFYRHERRLTNENTKLLEKEENLRTTLDSIGDAVITTDINARITRMNPIAQRLTGWTSGEAEQRPLSEVFCIVNAITGESAPSPVSQVIEKGEIVGLANHTKLISRNEKQYHIADSASPIRDVGRELSGVVLVFRDVSEEYLMQEKISESERQYRYLYESMIEGICQYEIIHNESKKSTDFRVLNVNKQFENIFEIKKEEIVGKLTSEIWKTQNPPFVYTYAEVEDTGLPVRKETYYAPLGKHLLFSVYSPGHGKYACVFEDITQKKRAEENLQKAHDLLEKKVEQRTEAYKKAKEEAEKANDMKNEFLANISHELRNPMHQILSYSKYGVDKIHNPKEKLLHYFNQSRKAAERLMVLLNDLLDLSKMESGKMAYNMEANDLYSIIYEATQELKPAIEKKSLNVKISSPAISAKAMCDYFKIGQVTRNLIANAIKFSENNKSIGISIEHLHPGANSYVKVEISDQGVGIPEEELETIFEKFTQSSKTKTGAGGTGLGLSICKEIINAHKGEIFAFNNPSGGATFSFTLPCKMEAEMFTSE